MSETAPVPPDAERPVGPKRPSRGFWVALSVILTITVIIIVILSLATTVVRDGPRPDDGIRQMMNALQIYAGDNDGRLPQTLRAMIPEYLSQENFDGSRFAPPRKSERLDWLYFPREKLDVLPPNTILLASPATLLDTAAAQLRIVTNAAGQTDYIPEADFQRLIREQNPPAPRAP